MNPWKLTAVTMGLVMLTALATGLVIATWTGTGTDRKVQPDATRPLAAKLVPLGAIQVPMARPAASPDEPSPPTVPTPAAIDACNRYAAQRTGQHDKTMDVVRDAAFGAMVGAAAGAARGAIADGGPGAGKGAVIGGAVGTGVGTLYGLNENRKQDRRYREAYAACMRSRGYSG